MRLRLNRGKASQARAAKAAAAVRRRGLDFDLIRKEHRRDRRDRHGELQARHLPEPARADHRRADAGRLRLDRHAGELPPLVLRQAVHRNEKSYRRGHMGLAYEIVINSDPCIAYLMEENTMTMQALVIAHAAYGHNSFFKGNYLFRMWTDADRIIDYLVYAKNYIAECEERHGHRRGRGRARRLPCADELRRRPLLAGRASIAKERRSARAQRPRGLPAAQIQRHVAHAARDRARRRGADRGAERAALSRPEPQENLLYFIEKNAPLLEPLAARDRAHRAQGRAVLLSAAPDPGDERGLGHVLALHAHDTGCTTRAARPTAS